jgi:hypothetical protein
MILIATFSPVFLLIALLTMAKDPLIRLGMKYGVPAKLFLKLVVIRDLLALVIGRHFLKIITIVIS